MSMQADGLATATPHETHAEPGPAERLRPSAPGRKPPHLSRAQILDATEACLETDGYDGTTIRQIAKRLDCAVGSIYRYFTHKRELLSAVTQRRFEPVQTATEAGLPMDQVHRMYGRIANEQPEQYRLMFWLASIGRAQAGRHLPAIVETLLGMWSEQSGDRRRAELEWAQLHGNLMLGHIHREPAPEPAAEPAHDAAAV